MKVQVKARNRAFQFDTRRGERILYAGLRNAIDLPYECGTGTCGTCKAKLLEGEIDEQWPHAPGKQNLKTDQGEFLMCQCNARTDLALEVSGFVGEMDPGLCTPRPHVGVVDNSRMLTHDVMAFDVVLDEPQSFDAGQFMAVGFPGVPGYRGYSMVNFERGATRLVFVIKKLPGGGVSEWLFGDNRDGVEVNLYGPLGHATFYPAIGKDLLCIAGGSGIAGMMSILSRACQEDHFSSHNGDLFFGVRTAKDVFYLDELQEFNAQYPERLRMTIALSDEEVPGSLRSSYPDLEFDTGFVHDVASRHMKGRYDNVIAYLAGPPPAVDSAIRMLLLEARLTTDSIRYDKFS